MHRSSSPYRHEIAPGSVTYTTSVEPDGRNIYHLFNAVRASFPTSEGVVSGIQWVPAGTTYILPVGAQPASAEFSASWHRGQIGADDHRKLDEWGRDEERRRRREEKEARRIRESRDHDYDTDLWKARERDARANTALERRRSFNANAPSSPYSAKSSDYPPASALYPTSPYSGYGRPIHGNAPAYAASTSSAHDHKYSLSDQFNDLDLDHRHHRAKSRDYSRERERKISRPTNYTASEAGSDRPRSISGNLGHRPESYDATGRYGPPGPYGGSARSYSIGPGHASPNIRASPNFRGGDLPYVPTTYPNSNYPSSPASRPASAGIGRSASPFSPGVPTGAYARSRPSSPMPVPTIPASSYPATPISHTSPHMPVPSIPVDTAPVRQLAAPEGFSRPVNTANLFPPFDIMKLQDMDMFWSELPRMPPILKPHDIFVEDWDRLMRDIALAWAGKLPVLEYAPTGQQPKRSALVKELIDLWNTTFFYIRKVELILFKGRERCTGQHAGMLDKKFPYSDQTGDYFSSSSSSEETDDSDSEYEPSGYRGVYGQTTLPTSSMFEAGRLRKEVKLASKSDRKKKRHEKHRRRRDTYQQRKYSLYLSSLSSNSPHSHSHAGVLNPGIPSSGAGLSHGLQSGMANNSYISRIY